MPRANFHDYSSRCIYHITLMKHSGMEPFGYLHGALPDVKICRSLLGKIIERHVFNIGDIDPRLRVLQYITMPDHIHFLLDVMAPLPRHVGKYIGQLKIEIGQHYRMEGGRPGPVFEDDFDDRILHPSRKLNTIFEYIRNNPRRLALKRENPDFFRRCSQVMIREHECRAYGNISLLDNPFKDTVIVHRRDTAEERAHNMAVWEHTARNGGVLVSPFISGDEKAVMNMAERVGGKIILIADRDIHERYSPEARLFNLCEKGQLLIIAPKESKKFSRQRCLELNSLAQEVAEFTPVYI